MAMLIVQIFLLLKLFYNVESQFMPQMGGMQPMQFPGMAPMGAPMTMGQPMPMPMGMPNPMQMPSMPIMAQPKLPMVVMPFQKKDTKGKEKRKYKKRGRRPKKYTRLSSSESDVSGSGCTDSEDCGRRRSSRRSNAGRKRNVLTPVISYVTKDGYVVYQKKIKKDKAKDWLDIGRRATNNNNDPSAETVSSSEEALRKVLRKKLKKAKRKHRL